MGFNSGFKGLNHTMCCSKAEIIVWVPHCDDRTQQNTVRANDLYSVQMYKHLTLLTTVIWSIICHQVSTQLHLTNISYQIISIIISAFWSVKIEGELH